MRVMKSPNVMSTTPLLTVKNAIIALVVLFGIVLTVVAVRVGATDGSTEQDGRLVTIHDRGSIRVVLSKAATVGDALKEADVTLDPADAVEPAIDQQLVGSEYEVNIYRARPVTVIDGSIRQKIITPYQTAGQIAKSAGITIYDGDTATLSRSDDIVSDGAGLTLTIDRATPFVLTLYGATTNTRAQGPTIADMLSQKGISLGENDRVSLPLDAVLTDGLAVRVWREGKQTMTQEEAINFTIETIQDGDQYVGYRATKTPGVAGSRSVTYEIVVQNGVEIGRTEIASITLSEPQKQVDVVGAKYRGAYTTPSENQVITWNYLIAQGFTREQTAGIMGNLMQEHRFKTTGDGLAQWTGRRKENLYSRPDPENIYTQLDFMMWELNNGYRSVRDQIKATDSVVTAVQIFQNKYEKCGICVESKRIQYAYDILASH